MYPLQGYDKLQLLYKNKDYVFYRGRRSKDNKVVIVKTFANDYPSARDLSRLQHEYNISVQLNEEHIIHALDLVTHENKLVLILEDWEGITLKEYLHESPCSLDVFFKIGIQLTEILHKVHQHQIVFQDLNTSNIIINPKDLKIKLSDFNSAKRIDDIKEENVKDNITKFDLQYISPEQTGRTNYAVDYRSDLYSLGIIFYEILTGHPPFISRDALELIYYQIAKLPAQPDINIPKAIRLIVNKLLEKNPDDRYQTAYGVEADLINYEHQWREKRLITPISLGKNDTSERRFFIKKLYGRDNEINSLQKHYMQVCEGQNKCVLITGESGIGKTSLVYELRKYISKHEQGSFISAKFDAAQNEPYYAISEALRYLIKKIMAEPEEKLLEIREKLAQSFIGSARILIDMIPEMELLIGKQADVVELNPAHFQHRFVLLFQDFIKTIAALEAPLVIFLDDMQWADLSTLKLLYELSIDTDIASLLLILTFDPTAKISEDKKILIDKIQTKSTEIKLDIIPEEEIQQLLVDLLNQTKDEVQHLAHLLFIKTNGNPFFFTKMLDQIQAARAIVFLSAESNWKIDFEKIQSLEFSKNVTEYAIRQINKLNAEQMDVLQPAACIGIVFPLELLHIIIGKDIAIIKSILNNLIKLNVIVQQFDQSDTYRFIHESVWSAAYRSVSEHKRNTLHLSIGRWYLTHSNEKTIYEIANQFILGQALITDVEEIKVITTLYLQAGIKAKHSIDFNLAAKYLSHGIKLLGLNAWTENFLLTANLYKEVSDCYGALGNFADARNTFDDMLAHIDDPNERLLIYRSQIWLYEDEKKYKESLAVGIKALRLLGLNIAENPSGLTVYKELFKSIYYLLFYKNKLLQKNNVMTDGQKNIMIDIITAIAGSSYIENRNFFIVSNFIGFFITLKYGYCKESLAVLASVSLAYMQKFTLLRDKERYQLARETYDLIKSLNIQHANHYLGHSNMILGTFINHWFAPLSENINLLQAGYESSIKQGDIAYANRNKQNQVIILYELGRPLGVVLDELDSYINFARRSNIFETQSYSKLLLFHISFLYNNNQQTLNDLEEFSTHILSSQSAHLWGIVYGLKARLYYLQGKFDDALKMAEANFALRKYYVGSTLLASYYLTYALAITATIPNTRFLKRYFLLKRLKYLLHEMEFWASISPTNYLHKCLLIRAEMESVLGHNLVAANLYDKAIQAAQSSGFLQYQAIAEECAARFYLQRNQPHFAKIYLQDSYYHYLMWGAKAKLAQLEENFSHYMRFNANESVESNKNLTFQDIFSINRELASEMVLDKLLSKILEIIKRITISNKIALLINKNDLLQLLCLEYNNQNYIYSSGIMPTYKNMLPLNIIRKVNEGNEDLILNTPSIANMVEDSYLSKYHPKSILCSSIIFNNQVYGVLYLENSYTDDAYTEELLNIIKLLSSQIAISLEKARIFASIIQFVPYEFIRYLGKNKLDDVKLNDQIQLNMTVLICDIRSFTTLTETLSSQDTFKFINQFLKSINPVIKSNDGFTTQYMGDAIISLFISAKNAIVAANEIQLTVQNLNDKFEKRFGHKIKVGIGIHTGEVILGVLGNKDRMEGSVVGNTVKIVMSVERLTKHYQEDILITQDTKNNLTDVNEYDFSFVGNIKQGSGNEPKKLWAVKASLIKQIELKKNVLSD